MIRTSIICSNHQVAAKQSRFDFSTFITSRLIVNAFAISNFTVFNVGKVFKRCVLLSYTLICLFLSSMAFANSGDVKLPNTDPHKQAPASDGIASVTDSEKSRALNTAVTALKNDIVKLNQDLYRFEEQLLYPVETQMAVFLALAPDTRFSLDSIELNLNDTLISSYIYQDKEIAALKTGGIQRLYVGSLADGRHKLSASFNGQGSNSRYFKRKKALKFEKRQKAKYIQLIVSEDKRTGEPLFKVRQW